MQFPVFIRLRRSFLLQLACLLVALLAASLVLVGPYSMLWQCAGLISIACLWWPAQRRCLVNVPELILLPSGRLHLRSATGEVQDALWQVRAGACIHPWLTVFCLENEQNSPLTVVVMVDSLNRQDFRRLRVFLRWRALPKGGDVV